MSFALWWKILGVTDIKLIVPILFLLSPARLIWSSNEIRTHRFRYVGHCFCYDSARSWLDVVEYEAVPGEPEVPTEGGGDALPDSDYIVFSFSLVWIVFFPILLEGVYLIVASSGFQGTNKLIPTILSPWAKEKGVLNYLFLSFTEATDRRALDASLPQVFCSEDFPFEKAPVEVFDFRDAFRFPGGCMEIPIGGWVSVLERFVPFSN